MNLDPTELVTSLRETTDPATWRRAAAELSQHADFFAPFVRRTLRLRVLATSSSELLVGLLPAAGIAVGLGLRVDAGPYGQVEQELLDNSSPTCLDPPDYVLLVPTVDDIPLVEIGERGAEAVVSSVVERWSQLWDAAHAAELRVGQVLFAPPAADPFGTSALRFPHSPSAVVARINAALRARAGHDVLLVDGERLAAEHGLRAWRDDGYYFAARQAIALGALPTLARAVAALIAAAEGLSRRCVVVDLDNTLWDGVVGEVGIDAVALGSDARGEAFRAFQNYLLMLHARGIALAVSSKNDLSIAEKAIAEVPGMRLRPEHFATIVADWRPKSEQIVEVATRLSLGLDSLVFVDDDDAECFQVRRALPQVDVVQMPARPSDRVAAMAGRPTLEPGRLTTADQQRNGSYEGLRAAAELRCQSATVDDFLASLQMRATVCRVDADVVPRVAQLVEKTNQFNLTARRRSAHEVAALTVDPDWICVAMSLSDRFADHGVVGVGFVELRHGEARVDTLLLSCRVIGRTGERVLLAELGRLAAGRGGRALAGRYRATARNAVVEDLYPQLGFVEVDDIDSERCYVLSLDNLDGLRSPHIDVQRG